MLDDERMPPAVEPFTGRDSDAPQGRTRDGAPRKPPTKTRATPTRRRTVEEPRDYREPILGLFQLPAGALAVAGMQRPILAADSRAVTIYAPGIAEALNDLAHERPEVAAALERVLSVGPYGALIAAVAPMALQILANHERIPPGTAGTVPATKLIEDLLAEMPSSPNGQPTPADAAAPTTG